MSSIVRSRRRAWATVGVALVTTALLGAGLAIGQGRAEDNPAFVGDPLRNGRQAADRASVVQTVDAVFTLFDAKRWPALQELFTERVDVDFSSLGGVRERMTREQLVGGWQQAFAGEKTSLHQTSNHQVRIRGDQAEVHLSGYAYNQLVRPYGSDVWETWGTYHFSLQRASSGRWLVSGEQYVSLRTDGNEGVRDAIDGG